MTRAARRPHPARTAAAALSSAVLMVTLGACGGSASGESTDALSEVSLVFKGALVKITEYALMRLRESLTVNAN